MCFSWRETANIFPDASASAFSLCRSIRLMRTLPITFPSAALLAISYPGSSPLLAVLIILTSLFAGQEASAYRQLNSCWRSLAQCEMAMTSPAIRFSMPCGELGRVARTRYSDCRYGHEGKGCGVCSCRRFS